jgi:hypothetical protein
MLQPDFFADFQNDVKRLFDDFEATRGADMTASRHDFGGVVK